MFLDLDHQVPDATAQQEERAMTQHCETRAPTPPDVVTGSPADDAVVLTEPAPVVTTGPGDDEVDLDDGGGRVDLGDGDDRLEADGAFAGVDGGDGDDTLVVDAELGAYDVAVDGDEVALSDRVSGETTVASDIETFVFDEASYDAATLAADFGPDAEAPAILVGEGTQTVTVNDPEATVSVIWDRVVQQAVIDTDGGVGPTVASRAYAMLHTAMYDAWATFDDTAVRVSLDRDGDNAALADVAVDDAAHKTKAMSYAAKTVLLELFPDQEALVREVMEERYGFSLKDDGSVEAAIGRDAAEDLLALRRDDGSANDSDYEPVNPDPGEINDITRWTPESVPIDPEDDAPEQTFLTPQWEEVESFALPEYGAGETDFGDLRPAPPQPFFTADFAGSELDVEAGTVTLAEAVTLAGVDHAAGDEIAVTDDLVGPVINPEFIAQAEEIVEISAELTDEQKIIAEFWEDGGGTAFPPGTFMSFAHFVSARDEHDVDDDAQLFLAMGNAVMDAGIATWEAKVHYDYVRPVRAIRDLGELGLIGEEGVDEVTGESGHVIEAWGGIDPETGAGLGTRTILAENWDTFQRPDADPSPPFAEYTSGHSGFSAAAAEVLKLATGSDAFGGGVTFAPGSTQFEEGVPAESTELAWATFTEAADEAGLSRLYGGIHFDEGDVRGRELGRDAGEAAYELAQRFIDGTAAPEDHPFVGGEDMIA
jgi:hypothetical protein